MYIPKQTGPNYAMMQSKSIIAWFVAPLLQKTILSRRHLICNSHYWNQFHSPFHLHFHVSNHNHGGTKTYRTKRIKHAGFFVFGNLRVVRKLCLITVKQELNLVERYVFLKGSFIAVIGKTLAQKCVEEVRPLLQRKNDPRNCHDRRFQRCWNRWTKTETQSFCASSPLLHRNARCWSAVSNLGRRLRWLGMLYWNRTA